MTMDNFTLGPLLPMKWDGSTRILHLESRSRSGCFKRSMLDFDAGSSTHVKMLSMDFGCYLCSFFIILIVLPLPALRHLLTPDKINIVIQD